MTWLEASYYALSALAVAGFLCGVAFIFCVTVLPLISGGKRAERLRAEAARLGLKTRDTTRKIWVGSSKSGSLESAEVTQYSLARRGEDRPGVPWALLMRDASAMHTPGFPNGWAFHAEHPPKSSQLSAEAVRFAVWYDRWDFQGEYIEFEGDGPGISAYMETGSGSPEVLKEVSRWMTSFEKAGG